MRIIARCLALVAIVAVCGLTSSAVRRADAADLIPMVIGNLPSLTGAPLYIAKDKGYYEAAGLDVQLTNAGTPADQSALLSTNRLQVFGGAVTAGFYNAFSRKLPVALVLSRAVSPVNHYLMARMALRDVLKKPADLKGRVIALDQTGTDLSYELLKTLSAAGLTLADVQVKYLPFSEQPAALATGAIDLALMVSPLQDATAEKGIAFRFLNTDPYITPRPMVASVLEMNRDWIAAHPDAARAFVAATLKATRYYCDAYHHGPNRADVVRILAKYSNVQDPALIEKIDWTSMDPDGKISLESIMDIQDFYIKDKLVSARVSQDELAPPPFVAQVRQAAGVYHVARDDHRPRMPVVASRRGAAIEIVHLCKTFESGKNSVVAIDDLSVSIAAGEFVCFVGPSGCGKSTLLRILAGLERADSGSVIMDGDDGSHNAMVFQEASIFPWKTVAENIAFGLRTRHVPRAACRERVDDALRLVGLTRFRDHYPSQISGGMKQRAAIARALVTNPPVLLMDEPFAALDAQNRAILQNELANICERSGTTVVYITHSLEEALMLGDRAIVLTAQPARIKDVVEVPFPRPRDTIEVSAMPAFGELKLRMWNVLEAEVLQARREQEDL